MLDYLPDRHSSKCEEEKDGASSPSVPPEAIWVAPGLTPGNHADD
jgi:hypothetical protein